MGILTRPKLMLPFQIARMILVTSQRDTLAEVLACP